MSACILCTPKSLPKDVLDSAAKIAVNINPVNHPPLERLSSIIRDFEPKREYISVLTTKYWHTNGVRLTVGFLDNPSQALRDKIILHMNAWSERLNVTFNESSVDPNVRITRTPGGTHWSYLGTDILSIDKNQPTMNLDSFTEQTSDSEFRRVVRHETGHTLGCPHEHMRRELVELIDPDKAVEYYAATQGWTEQETWQQVLTPIEESSLWGTEHAQPKSLMCYHIPGLITKNGQPIIGGLDIDESDFAFMQKVYPKPEAALLQTQVRDQSNYAGTSQEDHIHQMMGDIDALKKTIAILCRDIPQYFCLPTK